MDSPVIDQPGIYRIGPDDYHSDPCPTPSLSSSIARLMLANSPAHGWYNHPRLNPAFEREEKETFDLGRAAHAYLLEGESGFAIIEADDWRTAKAKSARELARLAGKIPLLAHRWADVQAMALTAREQLAKHEAPIPLTNGRAEQTLIWPERGDVWCRARLDWLHDAYEWIDDYKSTGATANPDEWTRGPLFGTGYDLQAAFYVRGLKVLTGIEAQFRFVVQENFAPFALSVIGLGPDVLTLAEKKRQHAVELWRDCLRANSWPAYPTRTCFAELPPWIEANWLARELRDGDAKARPRQMGIMDDGRPIEELLAEGSK